MLIVDCSLLIVDCSLLIVDCSLLIVFECSTEFKNLSGKPDDENLRCT